MRLLPAYLWPRFLKRRIPTSLWGRSLLIIVLPVLVMQVVVTWIFFDAHWQTVTARLSEGLAGDIAWAVESYEDDPSPRNLERLASRAERSMSLSIALQEGRTLPTETRRGPIGVVDRVLDRALDARLDRPYWFDTTRYPAYVDIQVQEPQGVLRIIAPRERAVATQAHIFVLWLAVATILLMGVAILFIRNQVRAIERLADAAEAFGRGETVPRFKPHGAREVRAAATAFLSMRDRIQRHIDQRTALLASVSHDLRTPLSTVLGSATTLIDYGATLKPEVRDDLLLSIREEAERLSRYVGDLLDMTRLEGGGLNVRTDWTDVRDILNAAADRVSRRLGQRKVTRDFPAQLSMVEADPGLLEQAVVNILENAIAYSPDGTTIELAAYEDRGAVVISIEDEGRGIPTAELERVFDKFRRMEESTDRAKGAGLGLAIAKGFVEAMRGRIAAASPIQDGPDGEKRGTRILISLPKSIATHPDLL